MRENMRNLSFCMWLTSLNLLHLYSFYWKWWNIVFIFLCLYIHFIHSSIQMRQCWLHTIAIINSARLNMGKQISVLYTDIISFGYRPISGVTGSYRSLIFSFFKEPTFFLHNGCTNLHSHQQYKFLLHILANICYFNRIYMKNILSTVF
jgi:hypothetical protein